MTGMERKKQRRDHAKRYTAEGLPRDTREWTVADWRDLHEVIERIKARVAERHKAKDA